MVSWGFPRVSLKRMHWSRHKSPSMVPPPGHMCFVRCQRQESSRDYHGPPVEARWTVSATRFYGRWQGFQIIDVLFPLVGWLIEGFVYPFNNRQMMIDGIPNRPLYFYQKDIIVSNWLISITGSQGQDTYNHIYIYNLIYICVFSQLVLKLHTDINMLLVFGYLLAPGLHLWWPVGEGCFPMPLENQLMSWQQNSIQFFLLSGYGGFHSHGGAPIAGWFMENPNLLKGWELGVPPILGHHHIYIYII